MGARPQCRADKEKTWFFLPGRGEQTPGRFVPLGHLRGHGPYPRRGHTLPAPCTPCRGLSPRQGAAGTTLSGPTHPPPPRKPSRTWGSGPSPSRVRATLPAIEAGTFCKRAQLELFSQAGGEKMLFSKKNTKTHSLVGQVWCFVVMTSSPRTWAHRLAPPVS